MQAFSKAGRKLGKFTLTPLAFLLGKLGVSPFAVTFVGLLVSVGCAAAFALGYIRIGGALILVAGFFDMLDGTVARANDKTSKFGAFIDSTIDRYTESFYLTGLIFYFANNPDIYSFFPNVYVVAVLAITMFGSLMVSYTKARAEAVFGKCDAGFLERPERMILLAIGALIGPWGLLPAIGLLAILANFTALQRIIHAYGLSKLDEPSD